MNPRKSFLLRIEPGLYQELERWAQQELRSVNGQIEYLLKQAVARRKHNKASDPASAATAESESAQVPPASVVADEPESGLARPEHEG